MVAIVSAGIGLVGLLIVGLLAIIAQAIPAVFHLFVFFERFIFMLVSQITGRLVSIGLLSFISAGVWAIVALLIGSPLLSPYFGDGIRVWLFLAGGLWGLIIGYQAALLEYANQLRTPGMIIDERPGVLPPPSRTPGSGKSLEEMWSEGIILGESTDGE